MFTCFECLIEEWDNGSIMGVYILRRHLLECLTSALHLPYFVLPFIHYKN